MAITDSNAGLFVKNIRQDIVSKFRQNFAKYDRMATFILQEVIDESFNITDTGFLALKSFQRSIVNLSSGVIGEFSFQTRGVIYSESVYYGIGKNSKYKGDDGLGRRYLEEAGKLTLEYIITGKYTKSFRKGSPNKAGRNPANKRII